VPESPAAAGRLNIPPADPNALPTPNAETVGVPIRVSVPAVGLSAPVLPVGLAPDGSVAVPPVTDAGWYNLGPRPGVVGPAVIVGHVDSVNGPAVFYGVTAIRPGELVLVGSATGSVVPFTVYAVSVVDKARFPVASVFAPTAQPELRLVTCTGVFDTSTHHYTDAEVVWAIETPVASDSAANVHFGHAM
jgi:Sortase domain